MAALEQAVLAAGLAGGHMSLVLLDIDHFKRVNDSYGREVGDWLLRAIADALACAARSDDTVARYGGEEFVILLPGADRTQAWLRAQDWRRRCAKVVVRTSVGHVSTTFSAGVATFPESGTRPEDLLRAADRALYQAKSLGRNRIRLAEVSA